VQPPSDPTGAGGAASGPSDASASGGTIVPASSE